jgi:hypothetical protein
MDEVAYFAAHAPDEIPSWFKVEPTPKPEEPKPAPEIEAAAKEWDGTYDFAPCFNQFEHDGLVGDPPALPPKPKYWSGYRHLAEEYETALNAWNKECVEIDRKDTERLYFQWRWYYGEQMAAHRGRD